MTRGFAIAVIWLASFGGAAPAVAATPEPTPPPSTFNVFYPEERALSDCLNNSIPLPNCGSKARGGWRQGAVFAVMIAGLAFIGWRITRLVRRNRAVPATASAPAGDDGARAP